MNGDNNGGTTTLELVLAWGFVGIPLVWGILRNAGQRAEALPVASVDAVAVGVGQRGCNCAPL